MVLDGFRSFGVIPRFSKYIDVLITKVLHKKGVV